MKILESPHPFLSFLAALCLMMCLHLNASAAQLVLRPQDVPALALKQGLDTQSEILRQQQTRLSFAEIEKIYDYQLTADFGTQTSKFQSVTGFSSTVNDQLTTANVKLAKSFFTGTTLALEYNKSSDRADLSPGSPALASYEQNIMGISLEQNLWRNFFGVAARADLRSVEVGLKASKLSEINNLQEVALTAIRAYWAAYVAQESFQESVRSRDRYHKVVASVKKKTGYGYNNPGDSAQAQAELESREQIVKTLSLNYLAAMDQLKLVLNLPSQSQIKFEIPEQIKPPPEKASEVNVESLRPIQASLLKLESANESLKASQSYAHPDVSLVGRYATQGLDPSSGTDSFNQAVTGNRPRYYLGVKLQYYFGSDYQKELQINRRINQQLADLELQKKRLQLTNSKDSLWRQIQAYYAILLSTESQKNFREKASLELSRSYGQGRTDIAILIDSLNKYFDAQLQKIRAVGNYQTALSEWLAFQDQLVPETIQ